MARLAANRQLAAGAVCRRVAFQLQLDRSHAQLAPSVVSRRMNAAPCEMHSLLAQAGSFGNHPGGIAFKLFEDVIDFAHALSLADWLLIGKIFLTLYACVVDRVLTHSAQRQPRRKPMFTERTPPPYTGLDCKGNRWTFPSLWHAIHECWNLARFYDLPAGRHVFTYNLSPGVVVRVRASADERSDGDFLMQLYEGAPSCSH